MLSPAQKIADALNAQRQAFRAFLVSRVGNEAEADDLLQTSLIKALRHADEIDDETKLSAWFYRVLRRALIDHYRSQHTRRARDDAWATLTTDLADHPASAPPGWEPQLCACLGPVIDSLPPGDAELVRRVDLHGEAVQHAAAALQMTPNHASVALHRARRALRTRLEAFCGACADHACLDCDCAPVEEKSAPL